MLELSVADQLAYEQLAPEVRELVDRIVADRFADVEDAAFYRGVAAEREAPGELVLPAEYNQHTED